MNLLFRTSTQQFAVVSLFFLAAPHSGQRQVTVLNYFLTINKWKPTCSSRSMSLRIRSLSGPPEAELVPDPPI